MSDLFMLLLLASPIVFIIYAIKEYRYFKAGEKIKGVEGVVFIVSGILSVFLLIALLSPSDNNSTDTSVSNNDTTTEEEYNNNESVKEEEPAPEPANNITGTVKWKGHELKSDIYIAYNDKYAITFDSIQKKQDCIQILYTFYNESGDTMSAIWNFQCVAYQNGICLDDNKDYNNHYYECYNEQTSIQSGYSIDNCSELIPIGDGSEITIEMGCGMWNDTHIMTIDPETLEYNIVEK